MITIPKQCLMGNCLIGWKERVISAASYFSSYMVEPWKGKDSHYNYWFQLDVWLYLQSEKRKKETKKIFGYERSL